MCIPKLLGLTLLYRPYIAWLDFVLSQHHLPLAISTSYGDDEQTGTCPLKLSVDTVSNLNNSPKELCQTCMRRLCSVRCGYISTIILSVLLKTRMTGARGISLMFSSGDNGVGDGDPNPATQQCFSNDGRNVTKFIPSFPASYVFFIFVSIVITF